MTVGFKQKAQAFSLNAIVDVRRRRDEMNAFGIISNSIMVSEFKIYRNIVALNSLHSLTEMAHNQVPVGNKSHKRVNFWSCSGHDFSIVVQ